MPFTQPKLNFKNKNQLVTNLTPIWCNQKKTTYLASSN